VKRYPRQAKPSQPSSIQSLDECWNRKYPEHCTSYVKPNPNELLAGWLPTTSAITMHNDELKPVHTWA